MYQDDVHDIAARYLAQLDKGDPFYREEKMEVSSIDLSSIVVLRQPCKPPYFCGFKPSGRPIFTHDIRLARSFNLGCSKLDDAVKRLKMIEIEVMPQHTVWYEGRHISEQSRNY